MKKITFFVLVLFGLHFASVAQVQGNVLSGQKLSNVISNQPINPCNLSVYIDSIVVKPCAFASGGGSCGCSNTLWAVVSGGTPGYTYLWTPSGATTDTLNGACYVEFTVLVTDTNGCTATDSLFVAIPMDVAGINKLNTTSDFKLYPVPASNQLNVEIAESGSNSHIEIYDMLGNKVLEQKVNANSILTTLDVSTLVKGNYLLRIIDGNGQKISKFSKE